MAISIAIVYPHDCMAGQELQVPASASHRERASHCVTSLGKDQASEF